MAKENHNSFREKLLAQEQPDLKRQQNFQLETKKMYTETLKTRQRIALIFISILIALLMSIFWLFSIAFKEWQYGYDIGFLEPVRLTSVWLILVSVVMIGFLLWPAIRGKVGLRFYPKMLRFVFWILIMSIVGLSYATFDVVEKQTKEFDSTEISWIFSVVILVIIMGVYMILSARVDHHDLRNKTKTLELEYRVAELEEKLKN